MARTEWDESLEEADRILCADAQTSGGLLLAVPPRTRPECSTRSGEEGTPAAAVVGKIVQGKTGQITVKRRA